MYARTVWIIANPIATSKPLKTKKRKKEKKKKREGQGKSSGPNRTSDLTKPLGGNSALASLGFLGGLALPEGRVSTAPSTRLVGGLARMNYSSSNF